MGTGGAVLARCPSCPPSPWISSRTRPLDLFIHQTHLLEIDWAGLCLLSSGPGEKPGHVTIQGRREETLGRQGEGALFTSRLHWVVGWAARPEPKAQPAARVRAGVKRPGHGRHPSAPLSVTGGPEPSPVCRSNGFGPSRDRNFKFSPPKRSHTEKQPGTSHLANSPSPPAKSKTYF